MLKKNKRFIALIVSIIQMITILPTMVFATEPLDVGDIEVNAVNFPDEAFRNWILNPSNLSGYGSDGLLTAEERNKITEIDLTEQNISNLTGIEHFSSLLILTLTQNRLTDLDLSQNTALEELYCSSNQLTKLDLSQNINLTKVYCASNLLTDLNIKNCAKLLSLNCEKNKLETLDLSGNPELIQLYCRHNMLSQLDVSHNTKLVFIETFDNQLTSFDCTMLTNLEFLHIDYNKLTTLDMSKNPNLKSNGFVAANNQLNDLTLPDIPGHEIEASVFYEQNPKQGYETVKWFYDPMYSQEIQETDMISADGQKIYAKWIANPYTVYYQSNGGQGEIPSQSVEYDQVFHLTPNTFTRTGYTFLNWNTSSNAVGGRTYTDGQEVSNLAGKNPNNNRVDLYAQWKANTYTIRYDANGGQGSMDDTAAVYDQPVSLSKSQFTKSDYVLVGWSLSPGEQNQKDYSPEEIVRNLTSVDRQVVTLYAVWMSHEQIQQEYQDRLRDFFDAYREEDYYPEDWNILQDSRRIASEAISSAGADESVMQQALETAISTAQQVKTKEERVQEIVQGWETVHEGILSQIGVAIPMDQLEAYRHEIETAVLHSDSEWLLQQSTLTDPASREDAVELAQEKIVPSIRQLDQMRNAIDWLETVTDWYQLPMESVKSTDVERYTNYVDGYYDLSSEEKLYCDSAVLNQLVVRKNFATEKQYALQRLDLYYSSLDMTDYTEENQQKLAAIMDETKTDIENADTIGMADRLYLESIDRFKEVEPIVRQKVPSIEVKPTASAITKGQKLSESRLTGGKAETEGTFSWKDGSVIPQETGSYPVVFTPKDSEAYQSVELNITVVVKDPAPVPDVPSVPDSTPDLTPSPESTPTDDSVLAPNVSVEADQTAESEQIDTEEQTSESDSVSSLESNTDSVSDTEIDGDSESAPEQTKSDSQGSLIPIILVIIGAVIVIAMVLLFTVKKRK
jgi:uncharacterized repeat protein (TIGR02543 family)